MEFSGTQSASDDGARDFAVFKEFRREAIRFWERRRIAWNAILVVPALLGYFYAFGSATGFEVAAAFGPGMVAGLLVQGAVGANLCFSMAYILEFWLADPSRETAWVEFGRRAVFVMGCLIGVALAFLGGWQIAVLQHPGMRGIFNFET